jgi:hypothetical protein
MPMLSSQFSRALQLAARAEAGVRSTMAAPRRCAAWLASAWRKLPAVSGPECRTPDTPSDRQAQE